jgi:outer membrane protein
MKKMLPLMIATVLSGTSFLANAESLAEIYNQAKDSDPTLLKSAAQRDAAFEAITSTRSSLLPQINLTAGYSFRNDTSDTNSQQLRADLGFSQELYNRSSWISLDTAEKTARQADSSLAAQQQALILRTATAYFEVLRAQDTLELVRSEKTAVARQLDQMKQRFEVGLSAITDVHEAQAQYDSVLASEVSAENDLVNSYEALRAITGRDHSNLDILDTERFSATKPEQTIEALVTLAEQQNLSLLAARISQDIARDNIKLASSGHLPSLTLSGGYGLGTGSVETYDDGNWNNSDELSLGLNLAVPLYTGGNITSQVKQAEFSYVATSEDLEASYRDVVSTVRASRNNINATIGSIRAYEQLQISAKSALEATEAGFDVGTQTIVEVLDATRRVFEANKNLADARYNYIISVLQLRQAVGALNEQDILDINDGLIAVN